MNLETVKEYFKQFGIEDKIKVFDSSSATVELASKALNCEPKRIAKTLSFKADDSAILIVCAGDTRVDNKKFKEHFNFKAKMLAPDEVKSLIGFEIGGVCPFGAKDGIKIYLDKSLQRFETVFPACGSSNSAIELSTDELEKYSKCAEWVDVCKYV